MRIAEPANNVGTEDDIPKEDNERSGAGLSEEEQNMLIPYWKIRKAPVKKLTSVSVSKPIPAPVNRRAEETPIIISNTHKNVKFSEYSEPPPPPPVIKLQAAPPPPPPPPPPVIVLEPEVPQYEVPRKPKPPPEPLSLTELTDEELAYLQHYRNNGKVKLANMTCRLLLSCMSMYVYCFEIFFILLCLFSRVFRKHTVEMLCLKLL